MSDIELMGSEDDGKESLEAKETNKKSFGSFMGSVGNFIKKGAEKVGQGIGSGVQNIKDKHQEHKDAIQLEKDIELTFNNSAQDFKMVIPTDKKPKIILKNVHVDYDKKLLTLLGNITITKEMFFVDSNMFKWSVKLVRANQQIEITIKDTIHKRSTTVVECVIKDDEDTIKQVTNIIDNSITIGDNAEISKSQIGLKDDK